MEEVGGWVGGRRGGGKTYQGTGVGGPTAAEVVAVKGPADQFLLEETVGGLGRQSIWVGGWVSG